jgi:hypothetical protein
MQVWARQGIDGVLEDCIRNIAVAVQKAVLSPRQGMTNVGEWTKKEDCWKVVRELAVPFTRQLDRWTVSKDDFKKAKEEGKKQGMQDDGIELQKTVLDLTSSGYWLALLKWPKVKELLLPADRNLVIKASSLQGFMKINIEKDWRRLLEIRQLCEDEGFRKT